MNYRPLKTVNIPLIFNQGIGKNTVDEVKTFSELQTVENLYFNQQGMLESCKGYEKLDKLNSYDFKSVHQFKEGFIATTNGKVYNYNTLDNFTEIGKISPISLKSETVYRSGSNTITNPSIAILQNTSITCNTWYEASVGLMYSIYDIENNGYIVRPTLLNATGTMVKCVANLPTNSFLLVVAIPSTNSIVSYKYTISTSTLSSPTTISSSLRTANPAFDVIPYLNGLGATVAYSNTSNTCTISHITSSNALGTSSNGYYNTATDASITTGKALNIKRIGTDIFLAYNVNTTNTIQGRWYGSDLVALTSVQSLGSLTSATTANAISIVNIDNTNAGFFVDEVNATYRYGKVFYGASTKTSITTITHKYTGLMIASDAFLDKNSLPSIVCIHKSSEQSKYISINSNGTLVAQFSEGLAGDNSVTAQLDTISQVAVSGTKTYIGLLQKGKLSSESGQFFTISGYILTTLDSNFKPNSEEYTDALYLSGAIPKVYDGTSINEAGFTMYPESLTQQSTATTGGFISNGTYAYKAVFEYYNSQGRIVESKSSTQLQTTLSGGTSTQTVTIRIPSVLVSEKEKVILALYRTTNGGTVFYKVSSTSSPTIITTLTNTFTDIVDTLSDTTIQSNQTLYSTGDLLENTIFPACTSIKSVNGRLWFAGCENRKLLYYTKTSNQYQAAQTASELYYDTLEGGEVLNISSLSGSVAVFKQKGIYLISGNPVNNAKSGSSLQPIRKITSGINSISNSVIQETSSGTLFCSDYGVQLLDQSGNVQNVGDAISNKISPEDVKSILYTEKYKHIRVFTEDTCWVFDLELGTWYEWPIYSAISAIQINNKSIFIKSDGYMRRETDEYSADNSPFTTKVKTGWLSVPDKLYVQRIYSIWPILKEFTDHTLRVNLYYDFKPEVSETFDTQSSAITGSTDIYGSGTYGASGSYYGGGTTGFDNVYNIELQPAIQECESFCLEYICYNNGNSIGKGVGFIGAVINAGVTSSQLQRRLSKKVSST